MFIVYSHVNKLNGKIYIGMTSKSLHERSGKNGINYTRNGSNTIVFKNAILKYGWDNFDHNILFESPIREEAEKKEIDMILQLQTDNIEFGYNVAKGGRTRSPRKVSEETKQKISKSLTGRHFASKQKPISEEHKKKISEACRGRIESPEIREKKSKITSKFYEREENRINQSIRMKEWWEKRKSKV